jgi:hypothetical protein
MHLLLLLLLQALQPHYLLPATARCTSSVVPLLQHAQPWLLPLLLLLLLPV